MGLVHKTGPTGFSLCCALRAAGFNASAFVTSYTDRDDAAFKGSVSELAWRSFAWFMSEPDHIVVLHRGAGADQVRLADLMGG